MKNATLISFDSSRFKGETNLAFTSDGCLSFVRGKHGTGKSTRLEALAFTGALFTDRFSQRIFDLPGGLCDLVPGPNEIRLVFCIDGHHVVWEAKFPKKDDPDEYRPLFERLIIDEKPWLTVKKDVATYAGKKQPFIFRYCGSVFSVFTLKTIAADDPLTPVAERFVDILRRLHYAGSLDPWTITNQADTRELPNIGWRGALTLPCYFGLPKAKKERVKESLRYFFPWCADFRVKLHEDIVLSTAVDKDGRKIREDWLPASFWRCLAVFTELETETSVAIFDELDTVLDGEFAEQVVKMAEEKQVICATSQPLCFEMVGPKAMPPMPL